MNASQPHETQGKGDEALINSALPPSATLPPSDYVIIGGTGDLALRKILPALFWRYLDGQITVDYRIIAASRRDMELDDLQPRSARFARMHSPLVLPEKQTGPGFLSIITLITLDVAEGTGGDRLADFINERANATIDLRSIIWPLHQACLAMQRGC